MWKHWNIVLDLLQRYVGIAFPTLRERIGSIKSEQDFTSLPIIFGSVAAGKWLGRLRQSLSHFRRNINKILSVDLLDFFYICCLRLLIRIVYIIS